MYVVTQSLCPGFREFNQNAKAQRLREAESTAATLASEDDPDTDRLTECDDGPVVSPPQKKLAWTEQDREYVPCFI